MTVEPQRTLTDLPFEVLDLIFKALACRPRHFSGHYTVYDYSRDKLSLAKANEYLGQAFAYHSRDVYKKVMYYSSSYHVIPQEDWDVIFSLCGSTVVEYVGLSCCYWSAEVAKAVAQNCPNLQIVTFHVYMKNCELVLAVINKAKNAIRSLKFGYGRSDTDRGAPNIMHTIPELPQLTKLTIYPFRFDEGYEIQRFAKIEELYLHASDFPNTDSKPLNLFKVCSHLKKLRLLTVFKIHIISETNESEEITEFPALEHFELSGSLISVEFPSCPKLKSLELWSCECRIDGLVCRSVLKQGQDLKRLIVDSRPSQFDNDSLLEVIRKFRKLRFFNVPIRKIKFDLGFVIELVNALKENGITEEDPLELVLNEISKIRWLRHWLSYISAPNLIKLRVY